MTHQSLIKAKIDLYNIIANLSMNDYMQSNYRNGKRINKKHIPYSLSSETLEAKEYYHIVYTAKEESNITAEQEESIKAYLLPFRTFRTEFIQDRGGLNYHGK